MTFYFNLLHCDGLSYTNKKFVQPPRSFVRPHDPVHFSNLVLSLLAIFRDLKPCACRVQGDYLPLDAHIYTMHVVAATYMQL